MVVDRAKTGHILFDPSFGPAYWEDVDLSLQVRSQGWGVAQLPGYEMVHLGFRTVAKLAGMISVEGKDLSLEQLFERNRDRLLVKWKLHLHSRIRSDQSQDFLVGSYQPKVSIVLPVTDEDVQRFDSTIRSVLSQDYRDWELLLMTGSQQTARLLRDQYGDSRVKVCLCDPPSLVEMQREGIRLARGVYLTLLSCHYYWLAPHLTLMVDYLDGSPEVEGVVGTLGSPPQPVTANRHSGKSTDPSGTEFCQLAALPNPEFPNTIVYPTERHTEPFFASSILRATTMRRVCETENSWDTSATPPRHLLSPVLKIAHFSTADCLGFATCGVLPDASE